MIRLSKRGAISSTSYPPPNRFITAPVSVLVGGVDERKGAGELKTSAEEARVDNTQNHRLSVILVHVCHLLMQSMQFMEEGGGEASQSLGGFRGVKTKQFLSSLSSSERSQERSRTTDRSIGDTGPPTRMSGSLEPYTLS